MGRRSGPPSDMSSRMLSLECEAESELQRVSLLMAYGSSFGSTLGNTSLDERSELSAKEVDGEVFFEAEEMMLFVMSPFFGEFGEGGIEDEARELLRLLEEASPSCKSTVG